MMEEARPHSLVSRIGYGGVWSRAGADYGPHTPDVFF